MCAMTSIPQLVLPSADFTRVSRFQMGVETTVVTLLILGVVLPFFFASCRLYVLARARRELIQEQCNGSEKCGRSIKLHEVVASLVADQKTCRIMRAPASNREKRRAEQSSPHIGHRRHRCLFEMSVFDISILPSGFQLIARAGLMPFATRHFKRLGPQRAFHGLVLKENHLKSLGHMFLEQKTMKLLNHV